MKRFFLNYLVIALAAPALFTTCSKDDGNKRGGGTITMTSPEISGNLDIGIAGTGEITIDWGDGTEKETFSLSSFDGFFYWGGYNIVEKYSYKHFYGGVARTITITGENITALDVGKYSNLWLTSLDVSGCKTLTYLDCATGLLISLDVSKNTALTQLYCAYNTLTSLDVSIKRFS